MTEDLFGGRFFDFIAICTLFLLLPLFFYKLGQSSLVSFDEAWYAQISNKVLEGKFLWLEFNGNIYTDHPPLGFWLEAVSFKFLGINEFSARFVSALCGFLSLLVTYLLGKELFNRYVGFLTAISLVSSFWFLYRARSGNLDLLLTLLFLLTFYLAVKVIKNQRYVMLFAISLSLLFLSKTLIPFTILPVFLILFWRSKLVDKDFKMIFFVWLFLFGGWFYSQHYFKDDFVERYLMIGFPGGEGRGNFWENLNNFKVLLHNGIGKWFWPGVISIIFMASFRQREKLALTIFFLTFSIPFVFSNKAGIWHLVPLHPFLILSFYGLGDLFLKKCLFVTIKNFKNLSPFWVYKGLFSVAILMMIGFWVIFNQGVQVWYQVVDIPAYISDEAILAKEAGRFAKPFYIFGEELGVPVAAFYSQRLVKQIYPKSEALKSAFLNEESFLLLVKEKDLIQSGISEDKYRIIKKDRDKVLIEKI